MQFVRLENSFHVAQSARDNVVILVDGIADKHCGNMLLGYLFSVNTERAI